MEARVGEVAGRVAAVEEGVGIAMDTATQALSEAREGAFLAEAGRGITEAMRHAEEGIRLGQEASSQVARLEELVGEELGRQGDRLLAAEEGVKLVDGLGKAYSSTSSSIADMQNGVDRVGAAYASILARPPPCY